MKTLHNVTDVDTAKRAVRAIEIQTYYLENPQVETLVTPPKPRKAVIVGVDIDREERRRCISSRLEKRVNDGMIDEVRRLLDEGVSAEDLIYYGLEYKFITRHVIGELSYQEMLSGLEIAIHQFAKRQMTWFRGMERRGFHIEWLRHDLPSDEFTSRVTELYETAIKQS